MIARIVIAVVFFAVMGLVVRPFAHFVVDDFGFIGWLAAMAGIFWVGITIENRDRAAEGRPRYSLAEAKQELLGPLAGLAAVLLVAWMLR